MNKKIILKNKSFTKMFSFLVVLVMLAFCSSSALAETIHVRLNLSIANKTYDGLSQGNLSWKNPTAKLIKVSDGTGIPVTLCDVILTPTSVVCSYNTKDVGTGKYCSVTSTGMSTLMNAYLNDLDPSNDYILDAVTTYPNNGVADLYYSTTENKLVSNKGVINHRYLTINYLVPITVEKVYDGTGIFSIADYASSLMNPNAYSISNLVGNETVQIVDIANITTTSANVGSYASAKVNGVRIEGLGNVADNYKIDPVNVSASISPKNISVKDNAIVINNKSYNGNNVATIDWSNTTTVPTSLFNGIYNGDAVSLNNSGTATFDDVNVGNSKSVAISNLSLAAIGDYQNYTLTPTTANSIGNIVPANLDVTNISMAATLTYGQSLSDITNPVYTQTDPSIQYQIDHWIYNGIDSNSYQPHVNGTGIQAKVYRLISGGSSADPNYNSGIITVNLTVNPKSISVKDNAIAINDKTYNGNNAGIIDWSNTTHIVADLFNGVIVGDSIDLLRSGLDAVSREASYSPHANATFSDVNVGTSKDVDITNLSLETIGNYQDYTLSPNTANSIGNVVPANLDVANISMTATLTYGQSLSEITNPGYVQINPSIQYQVDKYIYNGIDSNSYHPRVVGTGTIQAKVYRLLAGGSGIDTNYNSGIITVNLTVNPKSISVKDNAIAINDKTYNGNDEATIDWSNTTTTSTDLFTGIEDNDVVDLNRTVGNAIFSDATVADYKNVNITNLSLATGGDNQNYTLSPTTANSIGNIIAASLDATLSMTATLPYGQSLSDITNSVYIQVNSSIQYQVDKYIYNGIDSNSYQPYVGETGTIQAKVYKLLAGVGSGIDPNYNFGIITVDLTITQKTIVIDGITAYDKKYDGTDTATIKTSNVTYNTFPDLSSVIVTRNGIADDLTVDYSALTANFSDANVGNSKNVTISSVSPVVVTLGGADKTNYTLSSYNTTSTANITKAPYLTMKLKDAKIFDTIDYPNNFVETSDANDFDFSGFIGSDQITFVSNFGSENFKYRITKNGEFINSIAPQPETYKVVVNKNADSLRNNAAITLTNTLSNYDSIVFLSSERTFVVNTTPVVVMFPAQSKTEYGWTLREIYSSVDVNGSQIVTQTPNTATEIYAYTNDFTTNPATQVNLKGTFKWVTNPTSFPNADGDTSRYIFIPDVSYGGAYGDTISRIRNISLSKAYLSIKTSPSTNPIHVGDTVGQATITALSGEVVHKNKTSITVPSSAGVWSYLYPSVITNAVGTYPKEIRFTLTNSSYLKNYNSSTTVDINDDTATANVIVNPANDNVNPNGVRFEIPYGTKICVAETMPTFDLNTFILPSKVNAYPGTFKFIESATPVVNMNSEIILYRPTTAEDTTLWVLYTPKDTNYAAEPFQVKVKVTPKELHYIVPNYTKVYDGIATLGFDTTNLIANQIIDRSGTYDNVIFDSLSFELDSKNVGHYTQANVINGTVQGRLTGADNYNYVLAPMPDQASVNITPANLYVNVVSDSISIRETIPTFVINWRNFVPGENETNAIVDNGQQIYIDFFNLTLSHMIRVSGQDPVTVGSAWVRIPNGKYTALNNNYNIIPPSYSSTPSGDSIYNVLTVAPAKIKIIAQNRQRVYGEITNPPYFFDQYAYSPNRLYYDFDVYEYRNSTDSILISEAEKQLMFSHSPSIGFDSNTLNRQVGKYVIGIASNTQLRTDIYNNYVYQIIEHVNGILTINKATPRVLTLPTTIAAVNYGGNLSNIALTGGSATHPYVGSELATQGHFEWDTITNFRPIAGIVSYPVKYVVDDTRNYNNAIINNQYNDSINGYYNWTPTSSDPLNGAAFRANVIINQVKPVVIWPSTTILNYGQTLATALPTPNNGSTYNPIDLNPTFTWTISEPNNVYPTAGMNLYEVKYTPSNSNYDSLKTTIPVYTNKTTPTLNGSAIVSNYSYGQTLSSNIITASFFNAYDNVAVDGTINWVNGTLIPVNGNTYTARFTPTDQSNYNDKVINIQVNVDKITPTVVSWPSVSSLVYGQNIEDASISGGLVVNSNNTSTAINGKFEWVTPTTLAITGSNAYQMQFTPSDLSKYNTITGNVSVYTAKATPVVTLANIASKIYGYTLSERGLAVNTAKNAISHIGSTQNSDVAGSINWNLTSTTVPTVNNDTYLATFTPSEPNNYNSVEIPVYVLTTKATPVMNATQVNTYNNGQKLNVNSINLSTIPAYNQISNSDIDGAISWNSPDVTPVSGNSYLATFRPEDQINYTTVVLPIPVTVISVKPVVSWPAVSSLTYGQIVNDAILTGGSAVNPNNNTIAVAGNFIWQTPTAQPVAGIASYNMIFIPTDVTMLSDTISIQVTTFKATPIVTLNAVATDTYGKTLANRPLSYNTANNVVSHRSTVETLTVVGTVAWNNNTTIPTVANNDYTATFTPTDIANYNTVVLNVNVPTTKATPIVAATVALYSYGQALPINTPTLTSAVNPVNNTLVLAGGQLVWNSIDELPVTGTYGAIYYPLDIDNYTSAQVSIAVTVNASAPVVTWPSISSLVYGQTLVDADLTNGFAKNVNNVSMTAPGQFVWATPTTVPVAGSTLNVLQFIPDDASKYTTITNNNVNVYTAKATPVVTLNAVATDTYGKTLANRPLSYNTANNVVSHRSTVGTLTVAGTIAWNNNTTIPTVANNDYTATFTPTDINNYNTVVINVNVPTSKATPVVNGAVVATYTYGEALPAKTITLTNVVNPNDASLVLTGGTIAWNSIDILPTTGVTSHAATFTPSSIDVANYNPVVFNVNVTVNKANPAVTWPTTTAITYGQTLSQVALTGSHYAVNTINNVDVPGTFVWASTTTVTPSNTNTAYRLRFIPTDLVNYYTDSTMINLIINKAVPTVNWGTFSTITYGESLSNVTITNETAVNPITGLAITGGTFAWINPTIQPNVNNSGFVRTYTPSDAANYESVQSPLLTVVVNKANPTITQTGSPYVITYGQVLPTITATAINSINNASVNGNYDWIYDYNEHLPQAGAGTYQVRFTPMGMDAENYNIVDHAFNVQVNKAKPVVIAPTASSLVYEQTLAESLLTGGSAMNSYNNDAVAGIFTWELPTTIPNAGSNAYPVVFVPQDQNNYVNSDPIDVIVEVAKKHIDILISNLEHIYDGNQKEATFSDAEGRVDLTGMIDAKYYQGNTNVLIADQAPISVGSYRVIATILPTENYEGCDTAVLIINKNASSMKNPEDEVEIVNAIIPGMNQYFKIRDYEQMKPIKVRMINANGNQVYQSDNYTNNFDMSNLPKGTYFYTVTFTLNGSEYTKTGRVEVVRK